eukprot:11947661-Karenia_brevis.AAC.1
MADDLVELPPDVNEDHAATESDMEQLQLLPPDVNQESEEAVEFCDDSQAAEHLDLPSDVEEDSDNEDLNMVARACACSRQCHT